MTAAPALKAAVSALCCVRQKSPGNPHRDPSTLCILYPRSPLTLFPSTKTYTTGRFNHTVRAGKQHIGRGAAVVRKKRKAAKMNEKARAQAKKMNAVDVALTTTLAETTTDLDEEITSFGNSKGALRTYLQDQYKSRKFIHNGIYHSIPEVSEYRSSTKPFKLRMNPDRGTGTKVTTDMQNSHLKRLLYLMISEDRERPLHATVGHGDTQLIRRLPVIAHAYTNPVSTRLKQLQETTVQNMSHPKTTHCMTNFTRHTWAKFCTTEATTASLPSSSFPTKGKTFTHAGKRRLNRYTRMTPDIMLCTIVT